MPIHSFTAEIAGFVQDGTAYEDAFYEAGCDDATIVVVNDKLRLDFDRAAASYEEAVESAKRDIAKTGARVSNIIPIDPLDID